MTVTTEDKRVGEEALDLDDSLLAADEALDEFSLEDDTKIMLVPASEHPSERTYKFMQELCFTIPNMQYFRRKTFPLQKIALFAAKRGFSAMIVIQEKEDNPDSMFVTSIPNGPTAYYKISGLRLGSEMKHTVPCNTEHKPEVLTNNFKTRLGLRLSRHIQSLFPKVGDDIGRRSVVFHNQRDFIFFRHYRYVFRNVTMVGEEEEELSKSDKYDEMGELPDEEDISNQVGEDPKDPTCQLKEIGPRMTLRLRSLQLTGSFDKKNAEYEYMWRPDVNVNRARCEL